MSPAADTPASDGVPTRDPGRVGGPPRVLIVAEHASEQFGGEALLPLQYFRRLRARGIEAWMVVHERTRAELDRLLPGESHRIAFIPDTFLQKLLARFEDILPERAALPLLLFPMHWITQRTALRIVRRMVREHSVNVVHEPTPVSPRMPSLIHAVGAPVVIGPLNGAMTFPPGFRAMERRWVAALTRVTRAAAGLVDRAFPGKRRAALVLVANERTREALPAAVRPRAQVLIENGVDTALFRPSAARSSADGGPARFVFLGRLVSWKAVDALLEAVARVPPDTALHAEIIGSGPDQQRLESTAARLNLNGRVTFTGFLPQSEAAERLRAADALVLPSLRECGGAVVLEAMAVGLPVIAANWGGPADYLDGTCGILVDPSSREGFINGLRDALIRLASDPDARLRMGEAGRARLVREGLDWESKIDRMLKHYRAVQSESIRARHRVPLARSPKPALAQESVAQ